MKTAAQQYFNNFKNHCSTYQLERVANKPVVLGELAVMASCEVVDRVIFGESSENLMLTNKGLVARGELPLRAEELDFLAGAK